MYIPPEIIESIKDRINIVELISEYVNLKKSGRNYKGLCPFHKEKTPSFVVNEEKGIFHCFGCGIGGNIFTFLMKIRGITFPEAVKVLSKRAGIKIDDRYTKKSKELNNKKSNLFDVNRKAAEFYREVLHSARGKAALKYLFNRGLNDRVIETYNLGYAPDGWNNLINYMKSKKVGAEILEQIGLAVKNKNNTGYYDRFRNRIIFPIQDTIGRFIGFGGRTLEDNPEIPKYINTNDNELFHKGKNLYGFYTAEADIRKNNSVYIVEGYIDVIKMYQSGIRNVVAPLGTALTEDQAYLISRYTKNVFLSFDPDEAGVKAAVRSISIFHRIGIDPLIISFPRGMDPADFFNTYTSDDFEYIVSSASPGTEFLVRHIVNGEKELSAQQKLSIIEQSYDFYSNMGDEVLKEDFIKRLSKALDTSKETVLREYKSIKRPAYTFTGNFKERKKIETHRTGTTVERNEKIEKLEAKNRIKKEFHLLLLLLNNPEYLDIATSRLNSEHFIGKWTKKLWSIIENLNEKGNVDLTSVMTFIDDEDFANYLSGKLLDESLNINVKEQVVDLVSHIKEKYLKDKLDELNKRIKFAELENNEELLKRLISEKQIYGNELEKIKALREKKSLIS